MKDKPKLPREFWQKLADVEPYGIKLTPEQVESWFDIKWPAYSERRYKIHRRAIAAWWSRVYEREVHQAVERLAEQTERSQIERLESRLPPALSSESIPDFFQKVVANEA